jgi:hypothetical protein
MKSTAETATSAFRVRSWSPFSKNTLIGFLSLEMPSGLVINDVCLHSKNGSKWVSLPARQYELNGEKRWTPYVEFNDRECRESFQQLAIAAVDAYLDSEGSELG